MCGTLFQDFSAGLSSARCMLGPGWSWRPRRRPELRGGARHLPHRLELARRSGEHDHGWSGGVRRRHHQSGRRSHAVEYRRAPRNHRLLRFEWRIASWSRSGRRASSGRRISANPLLQVWVEHHLTPAEPPDDLGGQVVGRRTSPPLVTTRSRPWSAMNCSAASISSARSPTICIWAASTPISLSRSDSQGCCGRRCCRSRPQSR